MLTITLESNNEAAYVNAWAGLTWPQRTTSVLKILYMPFRILYLWGLVCWVCVHWLS